MKIMIKILCSISAAFIIASCGKSSKDTVKQTQPIGEAVEEQNDQSDLQLNGAIASQILLDNGLRVVVISSPTSQTASAAVGVQVGSSDNPIESQGLAHFLEHMLFLGTKEFPIVGDYKQFLNANNGSSNAYTSANHTNYYFDVRADKIDEAVHRLSRFFVSPLFDETFVEKEKSAVHNEFKLRLEDRKPNRAFSAFTLKGTEFRKFSVGNLDTLAETTADDTRKMFNEQYYAENMHAVISGPQSLKDLKALAVKYFSDIKSNPEGKANSYDESLKIDFAKLPARLNLKSSDGSKKIEIFIPVTNAKKENQNVTSILGSLLGDESPESLMVFLQKKGLARSGAGAISGAAYSSGLNLTIQLSDKGVENINKVTNFALGYVEFLKNQDLPEYLNEENKLAESASKVAADYFDVNSSITQGVNRLYFSEERNFKSWKELFTGKVRASATAESYKAYLNRLVPEKILIQVTSPKYKSLDYTYTKLDDLDQGGVAIKSVGGKKAVVDSIYEFAYELKKVNISKLKAKGNFELKKPNVYIPRSFKIYKDGKSEAFTLNEGEYGQIFTSDLENTVLPKAFLDLEIFSDQIDLTKKSDALGLFLLREMLRQQSSSKSYAMVLADFKIDFPIFIDKGAFGIKFEGWSDTYEKAFSDILSFTNLEISRKDFRELKAFYRNKVDLESSGQATTIGFREMYSGVTPAYLKYEDLFEALDNMTFKVYKNFIKRYFSGLHIRGALTGNLKKATLENLVSAIKSNWTPAWADKNKWEALYSLDSLVSSNPDDVNYINENVYAGPDSSNSLYVGYWSFGEAKSVKEKFMARILGKWIGPDFYGELRTKKQLAYSLSARHTSFMNLEGLRYYLLSSTADADTIETEVNSFIQTWAEKTMPEKAESLLEGTVDNILEVRKIPASPTGLHAYYANLAFENYTDLNVYNAEVDVITGITPQEVIAYGRRMLLERKKSGSFVKVTRKK